MNRNPKILAAFFALLFLGIPFEHQKITVFRPFARSVLHKFEKAASFPLTLPSFFEKHIHFYLSDVLILIIFCLLLWDHRVRMKAFFLNGPSRYLTLFFFAGLFSLLFSLFSTYYIQYINLLHFGIILLGFQAVRIFFQDKERFIHALFWGMIWVAAFECFVGFWQFFSQGPLGIHMLGELPLHIPGDHIAAFPITEGVRKLIELFISLPPDKTSLLRASGTFSHPNVFSAYLMLTLILTAFLYIKTERRSLRFMLFFLLFMQIFCLCLTFSRAGLIAYGLGSCAWFGLLFAKKQLLSAEEKNRIKPLGLILFSGLALSIFILLPTLLARGGLFNTNSISENSDSIRMIYHRIALHMMRDNPIFGLGFNCCVLAPPEYFPEFRGWIHNIYLLIGSEMGALGLISFLLFLFSLMRPILKGNYTLLSATLTAIFVGFLFIGLCDFYFLVVQSGKMMFFLFGGLLAGATSQQETKAKTFSKFVSSQA